MERLFETVQMGPLVLTNRVFMAPLTRNRADADGVPANSRRLITAQRASAGLIITEATQISPMGKGYINTPGIHSPEQVRAWSRIVESVHNSGGRIFLQLWHVGQIASTSLLPNHAQPVAPSAIRANSQTFIANWSGASRSRVLTLPGVRKHIRLPGGCLERKGSRVRWGRDTCCKRLFDDRLFGVGRINEVMYTETALRTAFASSPK